MELRSLDWWQSEHFNGKSFRRKLIDNVSSVEYRRGHIKFSVILEFRLELHIVTSFVILASLILCMNL